MQKFALILVLILSACSTSSPDAQALDTYCRDTFYITTEPVDSEGTKTQVDRHNSRRLCRCDSDCN
jgi:hypothetical protein